MDKVLSVIIPSYNVEKFLNQTLDSFICDKEIMDAFEVIVVDDGSKDKTAEIGGEYVKKYPDTFRVVSKENGGHGSTINKGIEIAAGKYFKVVDGDDWVNTEGFIALIRYLEATDTDYVFTNYYEFAEDTKETKQIPLNFIDEKKQFKFEEVSDKLTLPMHSVTIKTEILRSNNIRLDEHRFYVDVEYILFPIPYVKTIEFFDIYVYVYRVAQSTQSVSVSGFQKHIQDHTDVTNHLLKFADEYRNGREHTAEKVKYIENIVSDVACTHCAVLSTYPLNDKKVKQEFMEFDNMLKQSYPRIYELTSQKSGKLRMLRKTNFKFYKLIQTISLKLSEK